MGNSDKWTTPKQIKIERAGEPKGIKRGILKKGQRRKGKKARLDEVLSARNTARRYYDWMKREEETRKAHPEWYVRTPNSKYAPWEPHWEKSYQREWERHSRLLNECIKDGILTSKEAEEYLI